MTGLFLVILGAFIVGSSIYHTRNTDPVIESSSEEKSAIVEYRRECPLSGGTPIQRILLPVDQNVSDRQR